MNEENFITVCLERMKKFNIQDGDVLVLPKDIHFEEMKNVHEMLRYLCPNLKVAFINGDINKVIEAEMNNAGWYRKDWGAQS